MKPTPDSFQDGAIIEVKTHRDDFVDALRYLDAVQQRKRNREIYFLFYIIVIAALFFYFTS